VCPCKTNSKRDWRIFKTAEGDLGIKKGRFEKESTPDTVGPFNDYWGESESQDTREGGRR